VADRVSQQLVVAQQFAQIGAGGIVEIAHRAGRNIRVEAVRFQEHYVEASHDRTEIGQVDDQLRDHGARPRPFADLARLFSSMSTILTREPACAGGDHLEGVEGADTKL